MPSLTRDEAAARASLLRVSGYTLDLDLTAARESTTFESTTVVQFACTDPGAESFVELKPTAIAAITFNGAPLDPATAVDNRLPLSALRAENELTVRATMAYSNTGEGLHRFTDPEDGEVYLYAQAFLDDSQRIYACFDQPDLKAPFQIRVSAPEGWTVWGNGAATQARPGRWELAETLPISNYLVTVVAGPYHSVHDVHDGIPLGLIARRSLAAYLDAEAAEIFGVTRAFLDRYHELFRIRYPFGKSDQAFVPEFNAGAMENAGCVTFRDEFIFRSAVTETDREGRAMVIAHEMAHMWFGDLVTMRWFDDIWLNESFAEYMGFRLASEVTRFKDAWTTFAVGTKAWGYAADQRPSTHPVAPDDVRDTEMALLNFDGISYAKGASVLRQLVAWIGDEAFLAGLRAYFDRHAYGNATLADLLAALSESSGRDLGAWAEVWLRRPQVNTLRPEVGIGADGRYQDVAVIQTAPPEYPTLRPHRIGIGVYDGIDRVTLSRRVEVDLDPATDDGRTPIDGLEEARPGRLLLLNDGDLTYAKIRFDPASQAQLAGVLPALDDSLARALIWSAAADATRDAEMAGAEFVALAAAALPVEATVAVFEDVLRLAKGFVVDRALAPSARTAALAALAGACRRVLEAAEPGSSHQLAAARGFVRCAGPDEAGQLSAWLVGNRVPQGLAIDTELRWAILYRLVVLDAAGDVEIAAEAQRDPSAHGAEHAARARAAIPDADAKARAWRMIVDDDETSGRLVAATAEGFFHPEQAEVTAPYVARYFAEMPAMAARRTPNTAMQVSSSAYPRYAVAPETIAAAEAMLADTDLDETLRRVAIDSTDELRRALAAREIGD